MENRTELVPLTEFQRSLLALLARNRSPDSYLAGGAALEAQGISLHSGAPGSVLPRMVEFGPGTT